MRAKEFITEAVRQRLDPKCWKGKHKEGTKIKGGVRVNNCVPNQGVAEGGFDNASPMTKDTVKADRIRSLKNLIAIAKEQERQLRVQELELELKKLQGVAEASNTMQRYGQLILKRAKAKREAEAAEKAKQDAEQEKNKSVDKDLAADKQFDIIESMVESLAKAHGVDPEVIWEDFESVNDRELYETAAWHRKAGKNKNGGLNAKGVASYRREHPGSKLQTAVTTKPSKLKPGSKAAKRRKSFCARMSGNKGPMKKPNGDPTRKALALRKWNC